MWQQLVDQVGVVWIVPVLILIVGVAVLTGLLWWLMRAMIRSLDRRLNGLRQDVESVAGCRIENLRQIQIIIGDRGGPEMKIALEQMSDDSKSQFHGLWIPEPDDRLHISMLYSKTNGWLLKQGVTTLPLLASIIVCFFAFVMALIINPMSIENDIMRLIAFIPLIIGGLSLMLLLHMRSRYQNEMEQFWHDFIIQLQRKVPVYNQAAETAALLNSFIHYDQQMVSAAQSLSDHVERLASTQLVDAITSSIKYVMAASVAPPIQKSTDSLNLLAQQLERKLVSGENQLVRLYSELESRQQQQADLWIKRYQEIGQTLATQQKQAMQLIVGNGQQTWQELRENLNTVIHEVSTGQKTLQQQIQEGQAKLQTDLLKDQTQSLAAIRNESHTAISQMIEQYTQTLKEQSTHQITSLDEIKTNVLSAVQLVSSATDQTLTRLQADQVGALQRLSEQQSTLLTALDQHQSASLDDIRKNVLEAVQTVSTTAEKTMSSLQSGQASAVQALSENQSLLLTTIDQHQVDALEDIRKNVVAAVQLVSSSTEQAMASLQTGQASSLKQLTDDHTALLTAIDAHQTEAMKSMVDVQQNAIQTLSSQQQASFDLVTTRQHSLLDAMDTRQKSVFDDMSNRHQAVLDSINNQQQTILGAVNAQQQSALASMSTQQQTALSSMNTQQQTMLNSMNNQQQKALDAITSRQESAMEGFLSQQINTLGEIRSHQQDALLKLQTGIQDALGLIDEHQKTALKDFGQTQQDAIKTLADQQSKGVHELLSQFSGEVANSMAEYMDPVSTRLQDSAQALISAQSYARDVQQTLALQKEQARVLEESIRDVLVQLIAARENMSGDLSSMEKSTRVMSESAASMSAIYAGSQTGLSDAITSMSTTMVDLTESLQSVLTSSAEQTRNLQAQTAESFEINERQLDAVRSQIDILTNDLSNRIDQLMIGFSQLTEDLINNVRSTIDSQNDQLGTGLKALTGVMADEARSMSLYAQQINMDIDQLNGTLGAAVTNFSEGMNVELNNVLKQFDHETADILRRLSVAASEIGDAVEILPEMIRSRKPAADASGKGVNA